MFVDRTNNKIVSVLICLCSSSSLLTFSERVSEIDVGIVECRMGKVDLF